MIKSCWLSILLSVVYFRLYLSFVINVFSYHINRALAYQFIINKYTAKYRESKSYLWFHIIIIIISHINIKLSYLCSYLNISEFLIIRCVYLTFQWHKLLLKNIIYEYKLSEAKERLWCITFMFKQYRYFSKTYIF